jgi:hypothetical protein
MSEIIGHFIYEKWCAGTMNCSLFNKLFAKFGQLRAT